MRSRRELSQIIFMFFIFLALLVFKLSANSNAADLEGTRSPSGVATSSAEPLVPNLSAYLSLQ